MSNLQNKIMTQQLDTKRRQAMGFSTQKVISIPTKASNL
jgi:hypothetical protein